MPLELYVESPRKVVLKEYEDCDPKEKEVLIQTVVSGIKSGTEINLYHGENPFVNEVWDQDLRLFRPPRDGEAVTPFYPHTLGSWAAGVVKKAGTGVIRFKPGDLVHGEWKHRQTALMAEDSIYPLSQESDFETMIFTDPARFALAAIHDASIILGDRVAIFGMGAIGLIAIQMAKLNGASTIIAIDKIPNRLELAKGLSADLVFNPQSCDVGLSIKEATGGVGVDVAIEISGAYSALQQAIRCVHQEGLVVAASYYGDTISKIDLAREWHHNRITLRSSMPVWNCSHRNQPMWNLERIEHYAIKLLEDKKITVKPLIGERIPFEQAAKAYEMISDNAYANAKILLTYE
jgi:threonine dehydrogenase-like Zn-dependent dehydrogenase